MTRATNPLAGAASLLEKSTAKPGNVDMNIFAKKGAPQVAHGGTGGSAPVGQGTTSSDYLQKTREDNPEPETASQTESVSLSNCKFTTPPEKLAPDQPFEVSVDAKGSNGAAAGAVTFRLFCTIPKSDGTEDCQDQSTPLEGKIADGTAKASGTLVSPKSPVTAGTKLKYHVTAEHPKAKEKSESTKVEVEAGKTPKPLAVWSLDAIHFGFNTSFVLPSAASELTSLKEVMAKNAGSALAIFGHADPVGDDEGNKKLSGRRAYAIHSLLTKNPSGWLELSKGANGDKWDLRATQTILAHLKSKSGGAYYGGAIDGKTGPKTQAAITSFQRDNGLKPDGVAGPKTQTKLYELYMASICEATCKVEDFVGDPSDPKHQWACSGCGEFNPILVFSKADDDGFRQASDKSARNAKNAPNRRATVALFPETAKGPGNVTFPCPDWKANSAKCRTQLYEDADKRRNPSETERTWEKDQDTFACKFYAEIGKERVAPVTAGDWSIIDKVALEQFTGLAQKSTNEQFSLWCANIFGHDILDSSFNKLQSDLLAGTVPPVIHEIRPGKIEGDVAVYMQPNTPENPGDGKILISDELAQAAWENTDKSHSIWKLYNVLVHEYGHHIDYLLRYHYEKAKEPDAKLEEGARFAFALIPIDAEKTGFREVCTLIHGGVEKQIQAPLGNLRSAIHEFSGYLEQIRNEDRNGYSEHFGPGMGVGCTCGHKGIESYWDTNDWMNASEERLDMLYFGNWLRDYSQVVDPKITFDRQGISRKGLTKIVDFLAYSEFYWDKDAQQPFPGRKVETYNVTEERLGLYRPEEHIDNPWGITKAKVEFKGDGVAQYRDACPIDPKETTPDDPFAIQDPLKHPELIPDPDTWVSSYITNPDANSTARCSTLSFVRAEFTKAFASDDERDFLRHLGSGMHAIEDLFAHSNFVELAIRDYCHWTETEIPTWTVQRQIEVGGKTIDIYPLVTGSFGLLDTICSLLYIVVDLLEKYIQGKEDDANEERNMADRGDKHPYVRKDKFTLQQLLVNFLVDDDPDAMEVRGYKFGEDLRAAVHVLYMLQNHKTVGSSDLPENWPPEAKNATVGFQKAYEELLKSDVIVSIDTLKHQIDATLRPYLIMAAQLFSQGVLAIAERVDEFQNLNNTKNKVGFPDVPTHSQLSKDHGNHPLHFLAASCAKKVSLGMGNVAIDYWTSGARGSAEVDHLCKLAEGYIFHPAKWSETKDEEILARRKEVLQVFDEEIKKPGWKTTMEAASLATAQARTDDVKLVIEEIKRRQMQIGKLASRSPAQSQEAYQARINGCYTTLVKNAGRIVKKNPRTFKGIQQSISKQLPHAAADLKKTLSTAAPEIGKTLGGAAQAASATIATTAPNVGKNISGAAQSASKKLKGLF